MKVNLYEAAPVAGREMTVKAQVEEQAITFYGEQIIVKGKAPFELAVRREKKDVVSVVCDVPVEVVRSCGRCLETVVRDYDLHIERTLNVADKEAYSDGETQPDLISYIEDCTLDVDMLVLDELYTMLPMKVLCKEDCKGICKVCGTNLNESTCNCDQRVPDPRMAVFSDIFNQFKEV